MSGPGYAEIAHTIPDDHARPANAVQMLAGATRGEAALTILDLGCGDGRAVDTIRGLLPDAAYHGVDIESSPEVERRTRNDARFHTFDGVSLPFGDNSFDVVFTQQVLEHVRHPDLLVQEVRRVLRPGGCFVGSASGLEPYHSRSIFNLTPYGLFRLVTDNGMQLEEMRPGVDGVSLIVRQLTARTLTRVSLAYWMFSGFARLRRLDARQLNYLKLRFAGHICFRARNTKAHSTEAR